MDPPNPNKKIPAVQREFFFKTTPGMRTAVGCENWICSLVHQEWRNLSTVGRVMVPSEARAERMFVI